MDSSFLKIAGQIAGIGGLALGVFLLVFRDVIRKNIFPNLAQVQGYRIIRMIVIATFLIAALGIAAWTYVQTNQSKVVVTLPVTDHERAIAEKFWLSALSGDWKTAYDLFPPVLHQQMTFPNFIKASSQALSQFSSPPISTHFESADTVSGTLVISSLALFDDVSTFREMLTFQIEDDKWVPWSFVINPVDWPRANEYVFTASRPADLLADSLREPEPQRVKTMVERYGGKYISPPGWPLIVDKVGARSSARTCDVHAHDQVSAAPVVLLKVLDGCALTSGAPVQVNGSIESISAAVYLKAVRYWK